MRQVTEDIDPKILNSLGSETKEDWLQALDILRSTTQTPSELFAVADSLLKSSRVIEATNLILALEETWNNPGEWFIRKIFQRVAPTNNSSEPQSNHVRSKVGARVWDILNDRINRIGMAGNHKLLAYYYRYFDQDDERALAHFEAASEEGDPEVFLVLGDVLSERGEYTEAIQCYTEANDLMWDECIDALTRIVRTYASLGDIDSARAYYDLYDEVSQKLGVPTHPFLSLSEQVESAEDLKAFEALLEKLYRDGTPSFETARFIRSASDYIDRQITVFQHHRENPVWSDEMSEYMRLLEYSIFTLEQSRRLPEYLSMLARHLNANKKAVLRFFQENPLSLIADDSIKVSEDTSTSNLKARLSFILDRLSDLSSEETIGHILAISGKHLSKNDEILDEIDMKSDDNEWYRKEILRIWGEEMLETYLWLVREIDERYCEYTRREIQDVGSSSPDETVIYQYVSAFSRHALAGNLFLMEGILRNLYPDAMLSWMIDHIGVHAVPTEVVHMIGQLLVEKWNVHSAISYMAGHRNFMTTTTSVSFLLSTIIHMPQERQATLLTHLNQCLMNSSGKTIQEHMDEVVCEPGKRDILRGQLASIQWELALAHELFVKAEDSGSLEGTFERIQLLEKTSSAEEVLTEYMTLCNALEDPKLKKRTLEKIILLSVFLWNRIVFDSYAPIARKYGLDTSGDEVGILLKGSPEDQWEAVSRVVTHGHLLYPRDVDCFKSCVDRWAEYPADRDEYMKFVLLSSLSHTVIRLDNDSPPWQSFVTHWENIAKIKMNPSNTDQMESLWDTLESLLITSAHDKLPKDPIERVLTIIAMHFAYGCRDILKRALEDERLTPDERLDCMRALIQCTELYLLSRWEDVHDEITKTSYWTEQLQRFREMESQLQRTYGFKHDWAFIHAAPNKIQ